MFGGKEDGLLQSRRPRGDKRNILRNQSVFPKGIPAKKLQRHNSPRHAGNPLLRRNRSVGALAWGTPGEQPAAGSGNRARAFLFHMVFIPPQRVCRRTRKGVRTRRAIRYEGDYSRRRMVCRRRQARLRFLGRRQSLQAPIPRYACACEKRPQARHEIHGMVRGAVYRLFQRSVRALQREISERHERSGLRVARPALSRGARISN